MRANGSTGWASRIVAGAAMALLAACAAPRQARLDTTDANGIEPRAKPAPYIVRVHEGDSLASIAARRHVPLRRLSAANDLAPDSALAPGQALIVPSAETHTVRAGETISYVARRHAVSLHALTALNGLADDAALQPGQRLKLPVPTHAVHVAGSWPEPASDESLSAPARRPDRAGQSNDDTTAAIEPRNGSGLIWPLHGPVISNFGRKDDGRVNEGVNIAAEIDTPVRAAADGVVSYAGNEIRGYGNLILLRHAGGLITAYAHNHTLLVKDGVRVRQGSVIAMAGQSGSVDTPQLHFEVRQGKDPVDPLSLLGAPPERLAAR